MEDIGDHVQEITPEERGRNIRCDLVIRKKADETVIAILEFKREGVLRQSDFCFEDGPEGIYSSKRSGHVGNARSYMPQTEEYATGAKCHYIALLNWSHQILIVHSQARATRLGFRLGRKAEAYWISRAEGDQSRMAVFGWAIMAFQASGVQEIGSGQH